MKTKPKQKLLLFITFDLLNAKEFKDSIINNVFIVDLTDYIKKSLAKYLIFGHSHRNINNKIGEANCICNQLVYVIFGEKENIINDKYIVIKNNEKNWEVELIRPLITIN